MKHIVVCIKQVPDTNDIKWSADNNIVREGMLSILNPCDEFAINLGVEIKNRTGAKLSVVSMGPSQARQVIEQALAFGCDEGYLLSDKKFAASDTLATGKTLAFAIKKLMADFDLIICGQYAIDGDTAQTGATIANFLDIEHVSYVKKVEIFGDKLNILQELERGYNKLEAKTPLLLCAANEDYTHITPKIEDYIEAQNKPIHVFGADDLEIDKEETGLLGSPTFVSKVFRAQISRPCVIKEEFSAKDLIKEINKMREDVK